MLKNFKHKFLTALAILSGVIGLILTLFFNGKSGYDGKLIPLHWIIQLLIGPAFLVLAWYIFNFLYGPRSVRMPEAPEDDMDFLKARGIKIDILLKDCTIAEGGEAVSLYKKHGQTAYYDQEVFDKKWGLENGITEPVCIAYNHIGKIYTSSLLYTSKQQLLSKLDSTKKTTIYIHSREDYYYFDLEFLLD